jgi:hypothetical protein
VARKIVSTCHLLRLRATTVARSAVVVDHGRAGLERPHPGDAQPAGQPGEPAGGVVGVHHQVGNRQPGGDQLGEHPRGQLRLGLVAAGRAGPLGSPQPEGDRDPCAAVDRAPQHDHDVHAVDLAFLGKRVGPSRPRQPLGKRLLDHHVVQAQVAGCPLPDDRRGQQPQQRPGRPGRGAQQPVERVVARQESPNRLKPRVDGLTVTETPEPASWRIWSRIAAVGEPRILIAVFE